MVPMRRHGPQSPAPPHELTFRTIHTVCNAAMQIRQHTLWQGVWLLTVVETELARGTRGPGP